MVLSLGNAAAFHTQHMSTGAGRLQGLRSRVWPVAVPGVPVRSELGQSAAGGGGRSASVWHWGAGSPVRAWRPKTCSSGVSGSRRPEGFEVRAGRPRSWDRRRRRALRTRAARPRGGCGPRQSRRDQKPTGPHCSPVTLPLALLPLSDTPLSGFLLSAFQLCQPFTSPPAGLFSFLLSGVPERKVLFSAV